jgi:hypothetical protein
MILDICTEIWEQVLANLFSGTHNSKFIFSVVLADDCQCQSRNSSGFNPTSFDRVNVRMADESVLQINPHS